ncbi:helix-turn-helix transcriptional regulator [Pontibacterium sp. N1Y112]|uniref:Helix-turn-helix transcriptional regulator n=1 Tax=Pontibacterium sinense TaxID=2781979 RepID=A0A8J7FJT8_9GAMM|nr:XRE family transcriptional regulator [Pontibacterium sinense]MBE9396132.1 helix-turn-helix transcriptional regulator [Pontibacterium sinense]
MEDRNQHFAVTLKAIRKAKKWSLDRASQATGVSKAMLGQIERGESSPTLATLWKIAEGFETALSTFIEPKPADNQDARVRTATELRRKPVSDDMLMASMFTYDERFGFEMIELTLMPGYERIADPHEQGTTEHVIVVKGDMELLLNGEWLPMPEGSALRFAADCIHGYRNLNDQPAVFHNLIHHAKISPDR